MKIFWAWQSDTPGKIGRFLVRDALQDAIAELKEAPDIEEPTTAERREAMELDHDRKGVAGSPDLAATIFAKIEAAAVVVADVTAVGSAAERTDGGKPIPGKKLINSNVAIEVGWALHALTDRNVLLVFNRHFGSHEELPFDLRHKGGAITFGLAPDAGKDRISQERKALRGQFVQALRPYLQQRAPATLTFFETPEGHSKGIYFYNGTILARAGVPGEDEVNFAYVSSSVCYLRLMPQPRSAPIPLARLNAVASQAPLLRARGSGVLSTTNDYGAIVYEPGDMPPGANGQIIASTQLFPSGEIWAINANLLRRDGAKPAGLKLAPLPFEQAYYQTLRAVLRFASETLAIAPPWQIECGVVDIKGMNILMPRDPGWMPWGPVRGTGIVAVRTILHSADEDAVNQFLLSFFGSVFDATGYPRPLGLFHFPPGPPRHP